MDTDALIAEAEAALVTHDGVGVAAKREVLGRLVAALREARSDSERQPRRPTDAEIDDACMWFRHDYGLMGEAQANRLRHTAVEWLRAWIKVRDGDCPGWDATRTADAARTGEVSDG